jgi:ATP-binding cassette subfamily B protein
VVSFAAGPAGVRAVADGAAGVALVPAFVGESHFNALNYSLNFQWTPERRQLEYLRQMGASVETAKEVKIFDLHTYFIARYRTLSTKFLLANRASRAARAVGHAARRARHARLLPGVRATSRGARCRAISASAT